MSDCILCNGNSSPGECECHDDKNKINSLEEECISLGLCINPLDDDMFFDENYDDFEESEV